MSNESVRLPRDLVDLALAHLPNDSAAKWEIYELLGQPAQQDRGEPVTLPARKDPTQGWAVPGGVAKADGWNACLDEIDKLGPLYTHPAPVQSKPVAWIVHWAADGSFYTFTRDKVRGERLLNDPEFIATALYTHADPAEVERLRAEVAKLQGCCVDLDSEKREIEHKMDAYKGAAEEAATLRAQLAELRESMEFRTSLIGRYEAQLAEAHALLHEVSISPDWSLSVDLQVRISNALSESAEPSAPVEIDAVEETARLIYINWAGQPGYVPWVERGNSLKQDEARRQARAALERKP